MLELLIDSELSRDQRQSAELAKSSAESLLAILNDVLDISKIEAGQFVLERIPFDLHKMVNSVVGVVAPRAFQNGVEVCCEIHAGIPRTVMGDPVRLRQVLSNLVSNAVKFTRDGEVLLRLTARGHTSDSVIVGFSVLDTGVGIAEERLASIFDPFIQADESITRRFGGTGLGLAICRELVGLMGGTLTVDSEVGKGSEFRFALALDNANELDAAARACSDLDGQRVLLVDDNSTSRRIIGETLESACSRVMAASDVYSALRAARIAVAEGDPFVLAIVDASMPGATSLEFATSVRGDRNLESLKLMLLAAPDRQTDHKVFEALGIQAWLTKPVPQNELIDCVMAVLRGDEVGAAVGASLGSPQHQDDVRA